MVSIIKVRFFGSLLREIPHPALCRVEHLFKGTAYIRHLNSNVMLLLSTYEWRAPYIINVEDVDLRSFLKEGQIIQIYDKRMRAGTVEFDLRDASEYPIEKFHGTSGLKFRVLDSKTLKYLSRVFEIHSTAWGEFYASPVTKSICRLRHELDGNYTRREALQVLIGLGEGFTPAGDDFISGVLSSLSFYVKYVRRLAVAEVGQSLDFSVLKGTTWASSMYIIYSANGLYDELTFRSLLSIFGGNIDDYIENLILYTRRGHSSGLYTWLGFMAGHGYLLGNHTFIDTICESVTGTTKFRTSNA